MRTIRNVGSASYSRTWKLGCAALRLRSMLIGWSAPILHRSALNRWYASDSGSISRNRTDPPLPSSRSSSRANSARTNESATHFVPSIPAKLSRETVCLMHSSGSSFERRSSSSDAEEIPTVPIRSSSRR